MVKANQPHDEISLTSGDTSSNLQALRNKALGLLARREHSRVELQKKLLQNLSADSNVALVSQLLDRLSDEGLQSDERFTEAYVNMRARKGYGPVRIAKELFEKGIDTDLAQEYLLARDDWQELLLRAWQKKFNKLPAGYAEKAKQMRFLHYRGFAIEAVQYFFERGFSASDSEAR